MSEKNYALRFDGKANAEFVDIPIPEPKEGEALLKLKYVGICGSDFKMFLGKMNNGTYPITGGHEISAEVVRMGENTSGFKPGQIVTVVPFFQCGTCYSCRQGFLNCCENNRCMGVRIDGAYSRYVTMPVSKMINADGIEPRKLALVEPLACSHHLIKRVGINKGDTVLFMGAGPIGTLAMLDAKRLGATKITVADYSEERLAMSKDLGADYVINLNTQDLDEEVERIVGEDRFTVTIESAGHPQAFLNCIKHVSYRGRLCLIGVTLEDTCLNQSDLSWKEISIIASRNSEPVDFEEVIELLKQGEFSNLTKAISSLHPFDNAVEVFKNLKTEFSKEMKVVFEM